MLNRKSANALPFTTIKITHPKSRAMRSASEARVIFTKCGHIFFT